MNGPEIKEARVLVLGANEGNIGREVSLLLKRLYRTEVVEYAPGLDVMDPELHSLVLDLEPTHAVYSVGLNRLDWIDNISQTDFAEVMRVNVGGFVWMMQALVAMTWRNDVTPNCSVVAITSDAAWRPMRTSLTYCASKAALEMAVKVASRELAPKGWRINAVAPGKVEDTPMTRYVDSRVLELRGWSKEHAEEYELSSSPIGRKVTRLEVAEVVASVLFGPKAMTGEIVAVNGGR